MRFFLVALVALLAVLAVVDARRDRNERVPGGFRGDPCDKLCPRRDGWDRCEIVKSRGETSVKCTDSRPDGPGGFGRGPQRG